MERETYLKEIHTEDVVEHVFCNDLTRIMADVPVSADDIAALGHGGLCLKCLVCQYPACAYGAGVQTLSKRCNV